MIKIAHLYYDLLNLYGEQGNILALKNAFKNQNVEVSVDLYSVGDEVDFKNYDIVYIGSGSLESLKIAAKDIKRFARKIKNYIESDKYLIATGSSYLLFGKSITYDNGEVIPGLNIFDYYAKKANKRIVCHSFVKMNEENNPVIGFQNRAFLVQNNDNHLFSVLGGSADNEKSSFEGFNYKHFYGTHLIGPLLIRNPFLTDKFVKDILNKKGLKFHEDNVTPAYKAYNEYLKNFYEEP